MMNLQAIEVLLWPANLHEEYRARLHQICIFSPLQEHQASVVFRLGGLSYGCTSSRLT